MLQQSCNYSWCYSVIFFFPDLYLFDKYFITKKCYTTNFIFQFRESYVLCHKDNIRNYVDLLKLSCNELASLFSLTSKLTFILKYCQKCNIFMSWKVSGNEVHLFHVQQIPRVSSFKRSAYEAREALTPCTVSNDSTCVPCGKENKSWKTPVCLGNVICPNKLIQSLGWLFLFWKPLP